jgi:hypothetical protein
MRLISGDVQQTQIRRHEESVRAERLVRLRNCPHHLQLLKQALPGKPGITKGGSITVPLTSCLTRLD